MKSNGISKKSSILISVGLAVVLFLLGWIYFSEILQGIRLAFQSINIHPVWAIFQINLSLSFASFPLWSLIAHLKKEQATFKEIAFANLKSIFCSLVFFTIAFFYAELFGSSPSMLFPEHWTYEPFHNYWNLVLLISPSCYFLIILAKSKWI